MYNIDRAREISDARQIEAIHGDAPELSAQDEADLLEGYVQAAKAIPFEQKLSGIDYQIGSVVEQLPIFMQLAFSDALDRVYGAALMRGDV